MYINQAIGDKTGFGILFIEPVLCILHILRWTCQLHEKHMELTVCGGASEAITDKIWEY